MKPIERIERIVMWKIRIKTRKERITRLQERIRRLQAQIRRMRQRIDEIHNAAARERARQRKLL